MYLDKSVILVLTNGKVVADPPFTSNTGLG